MTSDHFFVRLVHDPEARVRFIEDSNVLGLAGEAESFEALVQRLPSLISDMVDENYADRSLLSRPVEVIGSTNIRISEAA